MDDAVDRGLGQRPDLLAGLATLRAREAEVRGARAEFFPELSIHAATGRNIGRVSILAGRTTRSTRGGGTPGSDWSVGRCSKASSGATA